MNAGTPKLLVSEDLIHENLPPRCVVIRADGSVFCVDRCQAAGAEPEESASRDWEAIVTLGRPLLDDGEECSLVQRLARAMESVILQLTRRECGEDVFTKLTSGWRFVTSVLEGREDQLSQLLSVLRERVEAHSCQWIGENMFIVVRMCTLLFGDQDRVTVRAMVQWGSFLSSGIYPCQGD